MSAHIALYSLSESGLFPCRRHTHVAANMPLISSDAEIDQELPAPVRPLSPDDLGISQPCVAKDARSVPNIARVPADASKYASTPLTMFTPLLCRRLR